MKPSLKRRISISSCWASTRVSLLDGFERYEDSYAITQEFREWITCNEENSQHLQSTLLVFPKILIPKDKENLTDADETVEV